MGHKAKEELNDMEERKQLQRSLNEQVLERATADFQWKQQFIEDPETATAEFPEVHRFRETYEIEAPPDVMPTHKEELGQLNRSFWEKVLNRAASDPLWKQQLLDDPEATLSVDDFPELKRVEELQQSAEPSGQAEVAGHLMPGTSQVMTDPYQYTSMQKGFCCPFYTLKQTNY
jgi:hypothetical protein